MARRKAWSALGIVTALHLIMPAAGWPAAGVADPAGASGPGMEAPLKDVFFNTNAAILTLEGMASLDENVQWLNAHPRATLVIEGYCDERGTVEYNRALGERRARAIRDYLVVAGIDARRLSTVSYGKERPFVIGHDEEAWKWDRRVHLVLRPEAPDAGGR